MERDINYVLIGVTFCALTIAMIAFIFWIGRFGIDERRARIYHVYTQDEIAGISTNTPVKYKGITVGNIVGLRFKDGEIGVVQIDVAINKKIPVREGSELILDSDGFVGMSYLNLKQNEKGSIITDDSKAYLTLSKNTLSKILGDAEGMSADVQQILHNIKVITDSKTLEEILNMLNSFQSTRAYLDETLISTNKLVKDLNKALLRGDFNFKEILIPIMNRAQNSLYLLNTFLEKVSHFFDRLERDPYDALLGKRN
ncbi:MlaD family protein [Helicobacter sp. MIT 14-3879]|uniref:MlaD family protein n=1 Tax=Helicobacter sp. MIT 14-3879 TaxID=2040649 RepID=UPI000E1E69F5|nr:MlaD family protein [Helicobacter sp. MIT 14-3879]RDU61219.1 MCE family protein [Helicobacter sp. MIT 14-3879]